jgi:hypothetical protein
VRLHQIKIDYRPDADRLILLASTSDNAELRMWLTRRLIKLLWPLLLKLAAESSEKIREQVNPEAKKALLGMEHEQAMTKADFSKPYEPATREAPRTTPLGEEPLLITRIQTGRDPRGQAVVALHPSDGQGVTLTLNTVLLHALCRLIHAAVRKSDWELDLQLPGTEAVAPPPDAERIVN